MSKKDILAVIGAIGGLLTIAETIGSLFIKEEDEPDCKYAEGCRQCISMMEGKEDDGK